MAFGNEVEAQIKTTDRDRRTAGEVILPDGSNLNKELVYVGLGWWYRKYGSDDRILERLESGAKEAKRGLWKEWNNEGL